jgi:hypothetical protein
MRKALLRFHHGVRLAVTLRQLTRERRFRIARQARGTESLAMFFAISRKREIRASLATNRFARPVSPF